MHNKKKIVSLGMVGLGPIGSIISSSLYKSCANLELVLIDLPMRIGQLQQHGLFIGDGPAQHPDKEHLIDSILYLEHNPVDILCFCTKAGSLKTILPLIKNKIPSTTLMISIQNGIDVENHLQTSFPKNPVARMVVNFAGGIESDSGRVMLNWFHPPNAIGLVNPDSTQGEDLLDLFILALG
ncbi:MAG: 2-dehydropantoate 2-reductase, partial [Bdellovibrionota bacterium]